MMKNLARKYGLEYKDSSLCHLPDNKESSSNIQANLTQISRDETCSHGIASQNTGSHDSQEKRYKRIGHYLINTVGKTDNDENGQSELILSNSAANSTEEICSLFNKDLENLNKDLQDILHQMTKTIKLIDKNFVNKR